MRNKFTATATGFLAAATLLGGSAFAFAPEFSEDLPTVIVTDRGFETTAFDPEPYVFRYSDAFELLDYIDLRGNQAQDLKYLFNEFDLADPIPTLPNTNEGSDATVLTINGENAFATVGNEFPEAADFDSAPSVLNGGNSFLTFRNRDFSGEDAAINTGFDNTGLLTGWDIDSAPQERIVQLYVKGEPSEDFATHSFAVITARADGNFRWDELTDPIFTDPADPFEQVVEYDTYGGWINANVGTLNGIDAAERTLTTLPTYNVGSGVSVDHPNTNGVADAGADSLEMSIAAQGGTPAPGVLASLGIGGIDLDANKLYRLRTTWSSPTATPAEAVRIRLGDVNLTGQAILEYLITVPDAGATNPALKFPTTPTDDDLYLLTKGSGTDTAIWYDILGLFGNAQAMQVDRTELSVADRGDFGAPAIVFNYGNSSVPGLAAGEGPSAPTTNLAGFTIGGSTAGESVLSGSVINTNTPVAFSNSANALTLNISQQTFGDNDGLPPLQQVTPATNGIAPSGFSRLAFAEGGSPTSPDSPGSFTASSDKLYIIDYYVSSPTANTLAAGSRPVGLRTFTTVGVTKNYQHEFSVGGNLNTSAGSDTRVYSAIIGGDDGNVFVGTDFLLILGNFVASTSGQPAQTYTIHRIVGNEYDLP